MLPAMLVVSTLTVSVVPFTVAGLTASEKVTVMLAVTATSMSPLVGLTPVTVGADVSVSVRSELLRFAGPGGDGEGTMQTIPAIYVEAVYLGLTTSHLVRLPNGAEIAVRHISDGRPDARFEPGAHVRVGWNIADARLHTG